MTTDLYTTLRQTHHGRPSGRGWVALDECPGCGTRTRKETDRKVGFSPSGWNCFSCSESGNLRSLAALLDIPVTDREYTPRPVEKPPPKHWQTDPGAYLKRYLAHPFRTEVWEKYRKLNIDTVKRWQLGVGTLPNSACRHERLIYPTYDGGRIVAFRGRHNGCKCSVKTGKWLTCGGGTAALVGRELLRPGATVFVCEAPPDGWLLQQQMPDLVGVAGTAGAGVWRPEWTQAIAESKPDHVVVAYDNDIAGMAKGKVREALLAEWWAAHPKAKRAPRAGGWWVLDLLRKAGLSAAPWEWAGYPARHDLSDVLMEEMKHAER